MGRFYSITVDTIPSASGSRTWSSQATNSQGALGDDQGALDIEFDFFEYLYGIPYSGDAGNSTLTIHGIALADIQQAQNFAGRQITMKAGMSAGFPLTTPSQAGTIMAGSIWQSFGNWIGTEMTLDFVIIPSVFTQGFPGNFVLNWQPGTTLQDALTTTITSAYATAPFVPSIVFQISGTYAPIATGVLTKYSTLRNLGAAITSMTKAASPTGNGVMIAFLNATNTVLVFDGPSQTTSAQPKQIAFTDFVGQPTWVARQTIQFTTVMRADISIGNVVMMPQGVQNAPGIVTTTAASYPSQLKYKTSFQGAFIIQSVRHVGNFRDPNGGSWVTIFQATAVT